MVSITHNIISDGSTNFQVNRSPSIKLRKIILYISTRKNINNPQLLSHGPKMIKKNIIHDEYSSQGQFRQTYQILGQSKLVNSLSTDRTQVILHSTGTFCVAVQSTCRFYVAVHSILITLKHQITTLVMGSISQKAVSSGSIKFQANQSLSTKFRKITIYVNTRVNGNNY